MVSSGYYKDVSAPTSLLLLPSIQESESRRECPVGLVCSHPREEDTVSDSCG